MSEENNEGVGTEMVPTRTGESVVNPSDFCWAPLDQGCGYSRQGCVQGISHAPIQRRPHIHGANYRPSRPNVTALNGFEGVPSIMSFR